MTSPQQSQARRALVVSYDPAKRNQIEAWLEEDGLPVAGCPGPGDPVVCPQIHGARCPLAEGSELVILDLQLLGDFTSKSAPGWVLLDTYLERGARVIALADPSSPPVIVNDISCTIVPRGLDQRRLLATVHRALEAE